MTKILLGLTTLAALTGQLPFEAPEASGPAVADEPHTRVRLETAGGGVAAGAAFDIAVVLESEPGWHTYWRNPGDAGMATSVEWKLPKGWTAGPLEWPAPKRFQEDKVATFGYEGEVRLLSHLVPTGWVRPGGEVPVSARVDWLECKEICLARSAEVSLAVPMLDKKSAAASSADAGRLVAARAKLPAPTDGWKIGARWTPGKKLTLSLAPPSGIALSGDAFFFPEQPGILEPSGACRLTPGARGGYSLELTPARMAVGAAPPTLEGVLVSGGRAWHVRVPLPPRET